MKATDVDTSGFCAPASVAKTVSLCTTLEESCATKMPLPSVVPASVLPLCAPAAANVLPAPLAESVSD